MKFTNEEIDQAVADLKLKAHYFRRAALMELTLEARNRAEKEYNAIVERIAEIEGVKKIFFK